LYDCRDSPVDEAPLKSIAGMTGGTYFKSVNEQTLKGIYCSLNQQIARETEETGIAGIFYVGSLVLF